MSALFDCLIGATDQYLHDMIEAESKSLLRLDSMYTGEKLLCSDGAIECFARFQAIIAAVARGLGIILAEIPQQRCPPALARFGIRDHGAQLLVCDSLFAFAFFFDKPPLFYDVADAEEHRALARQPIASRAPGFLVIPFDILRQIVMNNVAHVRLVDAHAKRDCCCDYARIIPKKCFLI